MSELHYQLDLLKAMNQKLTDNEKMLRTVCDLSTNAFLYYNFPDKRMEVIGCFENFFDFHVGTPADIQNIVAVIDEDYMISARETLFAEEKKLTIASVECPTADGRKWMEFEVVVNYDKQNKPLEKTIRIRDISKYKKQNEELEYMAYYDSMTGLYNRNYFVSKLGTWVRKAEEENAVIAVMCVDIDDFKKINDGQGLIIGDELVQSFAIFLKQFADENVIIAHVNSDQYFMAIYNPFGPVSVENIYEAIKQRLLDPIVLTDGQELMISVSVGVAEYPEASRNCLELINTAEIVMFKVKAAGKNNIQYFTAPILTDFLDDVNMENRLKDAIINNSFELHFQPQYDSHSQRLRGVEALVRMRGTDGRLVSPGLFIPIAEKNGMIVPIGKWVIEEGIRLHSIWCKKYNYNLVLSLNISAIQYRRKDFVKHLIDTIEKYQVNPEDIELEITESVLIDDLKQMVEKLLVLREYGIKISLDDFGTGFSSLSYLKGLPINTLKIDKSFIDTVIDDSSTRVITESIISMVKKLGYETVAEGVETEEQYEYLKQIDCDNIQGFLLGKPMPSNEFEKLIEKQARGLKEDKI